MITNRKASLLLAFFLTTVTFAQSDIETIVKEGIQYHDQGNYDKAIEIYKKALKIDPKSSLVNYEISFSYFKNQDYKEAIKYSEVVLKQNKDHMLAAYVTNGSSLDMIGKTKESIKLFEKAIKKTDGHYLLYYNLALNYYKLNNLDKAEQNVIKAIEHNSNHSSSHLMLAHIHNQRRNTIQTLLATHYFLFLEPDSNRSNEAYQILKESFGGNVTKDSSKPNTINISFSPNKDNQFGAAELMISFLEASKSYEENEGKTNDEMFVENTTSFFKIMGELKKEDFEEIWWTFYTPFFYDLAKSDFMETYCKYITQGSNEDSREWLLNNEEQLDAFDEWLQTY